MMIIFAENIITVINIVIIGLTKIIRAEIIYKHTHIIHTYTSTHTHTHTLMDA